MATSLLSHKIQYNLLSSGSRALTGVTAHFLMKKGWRLVTHKKPPLNPASKGVLWSEALLWGAASGMAIGMLRTVVRRLMAGVWRETKGAKPKEI